MRHPRLACILCVLVVFLAGCAPQGAGAVTTPLATDPEGSVSPAVYEGDAVVSQSDTLLFYRSVESLPQERRDSIRQETVTLDIDAPGDILVCAVDDRLDMIYAVQPDSDTDTTAEIGIYNHDTRTCRRIGGVQEKGNTLLHLYSDGRYVVWCEAQPAGLNLVNPTMHLYDRTAQTDVTWTMPPATIDNAAEPSRFPPLSVLVAEDQVYMEAVTGMSAEGGIRSSVYRYGIRSGTLELCAADAAKPYRTADGTAGWCALSYEDSRVTGIRRTDRNGAERGVVDPSVVLSRSCLLADVVVSSDFVQSWLIVPESIEGLAPDAVDSSGIRLITDKGEIPILSGRHAVYVESPSLNENAVVFRIEGAPHEPMLYDVAGDRLIRWDDCPAAEYVPFVTDGKVVFFDGAYQPARERGTIRLVWMEWP